MLSPLWSEQIVKMFALDVRYSTAMTLILNGITGILNFGDSVAMIAMSFIVTGIMTFMIGKKFEFKLPKFSTKTGKETLIFITRESDGDASYGYRKLEEFDRFLYESQKYFKTQPLWVIGNDILGGLCWCANSNGYVFSNANLADGTYKFESINLAIDIIVACKEGKEKCFPTRTMTLIFNKGVEKDLTDLMNLWREETNPAKNFNICVYTIPNIQMLGIIPNCSGDVFKGYYHPKVDMIKNWIDNLDTPSKHSQPRHFSIICHGSSGVGKTSIVKRLAQYTKRCVYIVNLFEIKKKAILVNLFYRASLHGLCNFDINQIILFIDEFDKVIRKLKIFKEEKSRREELKLLLLQGKGKEEKNFHVSSSFPDIDEYDWDIDDLLEIFCGTYIPDKRMIICACNDIDSITKEYPYLVRPGRLTPIFFDYGDRVLFVKVVKDYTDIDMNLEDVPMNYRFVQAHLIEFLTSQSNLTEKDILENMGLFEVKF